MADHLLPLERTSYNMQPMGCDAQLAHGELSRNFREREGRTSKRDMSGSTYV